MTTTKSLVHKMWGNGTAKGREEGCREQCDLDSSQLMSGTCKPVRQEIYIVYTSISTPMDFKNPFIIGKNSSNCNARGDKYSNLTFLGVTFTVREL